MSMFGLTPRAGFLVPSPQDILPVDTAQPVNDREVKKQWLEFSPQTAAFIEMISREGIEVDISSETEDGNKVVCTQHKMLSEALVKLEKKRKMVRSRAEQL